jgi:hypothetical protein
MSRMPLLSVGVGKAAESPSGMFIDCEENRRLRAVLVGMLRETDHPLDS